MASECSVLKAIVHPHIIALHEIFNTPKQLALVLEYARSARARCTLVLSPWLGSLCTQLPLARRHLGPNHTPPAHLGCCD
jgi:hypothetical protein